MTVDELAEMLHRSYVHSVSCGWPICADDPLHRKFIYELAFGLLLQLRMEPIVEVREP